LKPSCAVHFAQKGKTKDIETLYRTLRRAAVYMSDSIGRSMRIIQNGRSIEGLRSQANFHLEEQEGSLKVYLPKDETDRDVCFERQFPRRLCKFLGIPDLAAESVIGSVLRKDKQSVIHRILDDVGVAKIDYDPSTLDQPSTEAVGSTAIEREINDLITLTRDTRLSVPSLERMSPETPPTEKSSFLAPLVERNLGPSNDMDSLDASTALSPNSSTRQWNAPNETVYTKILENVVSIARKRVEFDIFETGYSRIDHLPLVEALTDEVVGDAFRSRSYDRNFKLGAAGELYVRGHYPMTL
jgi:hypothetical protein